MADLVEIPGEKLHELYARLDDARESGNWLLFQNIHKLIDERITLIGQGWEVEVAR